MRAWGAECIMTAAVMSSSSPRRMRGALLSAHSRRTRASVVWAGREQMAAPLGLARAVVIRMPPAVPVERRLGVSGGQGGGAGDALGGGLANMGSASFTGLTVNFTSNRVFSGNGGNGGTGGNASGGFGSGGGTGGTGGWAYGGAGGDGGFSSSGIGGGIYDGTSGPLVINPRLGAKKHTSQSKATDLITSNQALLGQGGTPGTGGSATAGQGGGPGGATGNAVAGNNGASIL